MTRKGYFCLFVWGFRCYLRIVYSFGDVPITGDRLQRLTYVRHLGQLSSEGSLVRKGPNGNFSKGDRNNVIKIWRYLCKWTVCNVNVIFFTGYKISYLRGGELLLEINNISTPRMLFCNNLENKYFISILPPQQNMADLYTSIDERSR